MSWKYTTEEQPPFGVRVLAKTVSGLTLLMTRCKLCKGGWCWHGNGSSYDTKHVVKWAYLPADEEEKGAE